MRHLYISKIVTPNSNTPLSILVVIIVFAFLIFSSGFNKGFGEIIPLDRRINWDPGIPGGIPTYPVEIIATDPPFNADNSGLTYATSAINNALRACSYGHAVLLPSGTYRVDGPLTIPSGVVLRGNGPSNTKIICNSCSGTTAVDFNIIEIKTVSSSIETDVVSGYIKGSTSIVVNNAIGFQIGDYAVLDQMNDPSFVDPNGANCNYCSFISADKSTRLLGQIVEIRNINGTTFTIDPPLVWTFESKYDPELHKLCKNPVEYAGIEDLYIERSSGTNGNNVFMGGVSYCWIKNIESYNSGYDHIYLRSCFRCEVRDSYIHHGHSYAGGHAYGVMLFNHCSDCLVENNIFYNLRHSMVIEAGGCGNVFGYNYSDRMFAWDYPDTDWIMADLSTHGAHPIMNLFEGNIANHIGPDYTHGSGSHNTFFRNFIDRESERAGGGLMINHLICADIHKYNYYINVVGNVLGQSTDTGIYEYENSNCSHTTPAVYKLGYLNDGDSTAADNDSNVKATLLGHGNYDYINDTIVWDASIVDHNLPNSYYLSSKPSFFGSLPWPIIGPDLDPMVGNIPAKLRYGEILLYSPEPPQNLRIDY